MHLPCDCAEEMELLFVSLAPPVLLDRPLLDDFVTCLEAKCWLYRCLEAELKLPLVLLAEEVIEILSPHILLLVPILSWLGRLLMEPPVIPPLDVVGAWSLLPVLNVTETLEGKCCCSEEWFRISVNWLNDKIFI